MHSKFSNNDTDDGYDIYHQNFLCKNHNILQFKRASDKIVEIFPHEKNTLRNKIVEQKKAA